MIHDADSFLQFLAAEKRLSPNTLSAYRNDLRQFEEYLAARQHDPLGNGSANGNGHAVSAHADPTTASREQIAGFFLSLREDKGYSAATIARKMAAQSGSLGPLMQPTAPPPSRVTPVPANRAFRSIPIASCAGSNLSIRTGMRLDAAQLTASPFTG